MGDVAQAVLGWHFTGDTLRDGRPIPKPGDTLRHEGAISICRSGLHASRKALDALGYAPGPIVHRVKCAGMIDEYPEKLVCSKRTILWSADVTKTVWAFSRWCALQVIHLWDAPDALRRYLESGSEADWPSAKEAADTVRWPVGLSLLGLASTTYASRSARKATAETINRSVTLGAAREAARYTAQALAWDAAKDSRWAETWSGAEIMQNEKLEEMLEDLHKELSNG